MARAKAAVYTVGMRLTEETALACFTVFRAWFGPPPAEYRGDLLDGRVRVQVCAALGVCPPNAVRLATVEEALRWLLVAGHTNRAYELAEASDIPVDELLHVRLGLPVFLVTPAIVVRKRRAPRRPAPSHVAQVKFLLRLANSAAQANRYLDPHEIIEACT